MSKYFAAYGATLVVMLVLDLLWIGFLAKPMYQQGIGHLMAEQPRLLVALAFYLVYALGLTVFSVVPNTSSAHWWSAALSGALFGFFAYATYDLTNLATLRNWPVGLAALDMAWGTLVSGLCAGAGRLALERVSST